MSDSFNLADELNSLDDEQINDVLAPVGNYLFEVKTAEAGQSKNGLPMVTVRAVYLEGPKESQSEFIRIYYSKKSDNAIRFFWRQLKALGVDQDWIQENGATLDQAATKMVGAQFTGRLTHEKDLNDEPRARVNPSKFEQYNEDTKLEDEFAGVAAEYTDPLAVGDEPAQDLTGAAADAKPVQDKTLTGVVAGPAADPGAAAGDEDPWG